MYKRQPLGYVKDTDKKGHLLIDPETRWIVEKIFDLAVHGRGAASITRILVEEKVPTPGWLHYERYGTFANIYAGAPAEKAYAWTIAQVKSCLLYTSTCLTFPCRAYFIYGGNCLWQKAKTRAITKTAAKPSSSSTTTTSFAIVPFPCLISSACPVVSAISDEMSLFDSFGSSDVYKRQVQSLLDYDRT